MTAQKDWDRARWLWWLALAGGISFFIAVFQRLDGPAIWAWTATGVGLLTLWAAANARERNGWLIAAALGFGALGHWLLDAKGRGTGAVAFGVGPLLHQKSVGSGQSGSVRVDFGGICIIDTKNKQRFIKVKLFCLFKLKTAY